MAEVSRLKKGVVVVSKKWWPEMMRLVGERHSCSAEVRLKVSATEGSSERRLGYVEATQVALKSVATAPTATGAAELLVVEQV